MKVPPINEKNLTFELVNSRDWTLLFAEAARQLFTGSMENEFGWRYTDVVYVYDGVNVANYRATEEHWNEMFSMLTTKIDADEKFFPLMLSRLQNEFVSLKQVVSEGLSGDLDKLNNRELYEIAHDARAHLLVAGPKYVVAAFFPQHLERFSGAADRYQEEGEAAVEARFDMDKFFVPKTNQLFEEVAEEALQRVGVSKELSSVITFDELSKLLLSTHNNNFIDNLERKLSQRNNHYLLGGGIVYEEVSLDTYIERNGWVLENTPDEDVECVKGNVAYQASSPLQGTVRVVKNIDDLSKINEGDIIVSPMTTPEYVSRLKDVTAIITDEGGVTCHAAVIARELEIPCIIGTKHSTRVFEDGDMVEVDANEGVVMLTDEG